MLKPYLAVVLCTDDALDDVHALVASCEDDATLAVRLTDAERTTIADLIAAIADRSDAMAGINQTADAKAN